MAQESFLEKKNKLRAFKEEIIERNLINDKEYFNVVDIPDDIFYQCEECSNSILTEELKSNLFVCPYCGHHHKLKAKNRIKQICDSFYELDSNMDTVNLGFEGYESKLKSYQEKTHMKDAVITGECDIYDIRCAIGVMDSYFMMGSMGSVVGEKLTRLIEYATKNLLPLIIFSTSGGARMQEGIISLMQMAKTSQAIAKYKECGGLFISVLTNPTTGGVSASFASLGDITIAEPDALIGFAGRRVIENTIKESLPPDFQKSEFLLNHGFLDMIVERKSLKDKLYKILKLHNF